MRLHHGQLFLLSLPLLAAPLAAQCEVAELKGLNTQSLDSFGKSCDIDGSRLVVGSFAASTGRPGVVHVFEQRGERWVQVARLLAKSARAGDQVGNSVGISGDFVVTGAEFHDTALGNNTGAAYVFQRNASGRWVEVQELRPSDDVRGHNFGEYVAIEGGVAVIGCRFDAELGNNAGAAYVFERGLDGRWVETAKLLGSAGKRNDLSGDTVAIDGGRIVMGSYRSDASGGHSGSAYVFEKIGGAWTEVARLVASDGAGELSRGVAIDGDRIVLGARLDSTKGTAAGAGYVFEKWNGQWSQTAKLVPASALAEDWIGEAVAVDGDRIVLSGHHHDLVGSNSGVAYVYELQNGQWVETKMLQSSAASLNDEFSFAVALSGTNLVATSPYETGNVGAAYVFTFDEALCGCAGASGGTAAPYGEYLGAANVGRLETSTLPNPGSSMVFSISQIPGGTSGTLFIGPQKVEKLAYGGTLLVANTTAPIKIPFRLSLGAATVTWSVPPSLCGTTLYAQATALDATQSSGRAFTNGLELVLGQ